MHLLRFSFFFFFQAEDGIRDFHVTGVQTCALPISILPKLGAQSSRSSPLGSPPQIQCTRLAGLGGQAASAGAVEAGLVALLSLTNSTPPNSPTRSIRCGSPQKLARPARTSSRPSPSSSAMAAATAAFCRLCGPCSQGQSAWCAPQPA